MQEFSNLGVNFRSLPFCSNREEVRNYNKAEHLFLTMKSFAINHGLYEKYAGFFKNENAIPAEWHTPCRNRNNKFNNVN